MTPPMDFTRDFQTLLACLPADYAELANEHRQLQVQYGNAKIRTAEELLRTFFVHVGCDLSVRQTSAVLAATGGPPISPMRIHKKMLRAGPYLHALIERMAPRERCLAAESWLGYEMISVDATTVSGPGAEGADARIHTALRLSDLALVHAQVSGVDVGETLKNFDWKPGQLAIGDRAYCNANGIESVHDRGAAVLVRLNIHSMPTLRDAQGEVLTADGLLDWLRGFGDHDANERTIYFKTRSGQTIEARIIARQLREHEAAQSRAWLRREHKASAITPWQDAIAGYMVLLTTSCLSATQAIEAYRLRWQIELQFKRWKSLCGFDRMPNFLDDTILAWIYVKVLLGLILERLTSASTEVFPPEPFPRNTARGPAFTTHLNTVFRTDLRFLARTDRATALAHHAAALDGHRAHPRAAPSA